MTQNLPKTDIERKEKANVETRAAALINGSSERIAAGEPSSDGFAFPDEMDRKYGG